MIQFTRGFQWDFLDMNFETIERLVKEAQRPLQIVRLEALQDDALGEDNRENYYRFLYLLAKEMQATVTLEIGSGPNALASIHMMSAMRGRKTLAIGIDKIDLDIKRAKYMHLNLDSTSDKAKSQVAKVSKSYGPIQIIYQDSSHHYHQSVMEWNNFSPFLAPQAVWVCNAITPDFKLPNESKGMVEYFHERPGKKTLYPDVLLKGNTIGVILNG